MINSISEVVVDETALLKLWKHECTRVISDRFTNHRDEDWFTNNLCTLVSEELGEDAADVVREESYFVDFLREPPEPTGDEPDDFDFSPPKVYDPIPSFDFLKEKLQGYVRNVFVYKLYFTVCSYEYDLIYFF